MQFYFTAAVIPILPRHTQFNLYSKNDRLYQETAGYYEQAYLIGGGHSRLDVIWASSAGIKKPLNPWWAEQFVLDGS